MSLTLGTFCSGIGSPELAATRLGWKCKWSSEIEPFPSAVLAHHFPHTPNLGDMTKLHGGDLERVDVVFAGTPCQSFSVAGLREGMDDPRGNLALVFLRLIDSARPRWVVWENVPGVLSSSDGRDFGCFLGGLGQLGYGWAYRVLDAQFVRVHGHEHAVPQRRRRVFVVGYLGDWRRAAAVLFERNCLSGNPAPSREAGKGFAREVAASLRSSGAGTSRVGDTRGQDNIVCAPVAPTLDASYAKKWGLDNQHVNAGCPLFVTSGQSNAAIVENVAPALNSTNEQPYITACFNERQVTSNVNRDRCRPEVSGTLHSSAPSVAFTIHGTDKTAKVASETDMCGSLRTKPPGSIENSSTTVICHSYGVRRLMPVECERLQGFPDNWTNVTRRNKSAADGPRYKAIGNSIAVNCSRWILERIQMVESINQMSAPSPPESAERGKL